MKRTVKAGYMTAAAVTLVASAGASAQTATTVVGTSADACSAATAGAVAFHPSADAPHVLTLKNGNVVKLTESDFTKSDDGTMTWKSDDGSRVIVKKRVENVTGEKVAFAASKVGDGEVTFTRVAPSVTALRVGGMQHGDTVVADKDGRTFHVKRPDGSKVALRESVVDGKEMQGTECRIMVRMMKEDTK